MLVAAATLPGTGIVFVIVPPHPANIRGCRVCHQHILYVCAQMWQLFCAIVTFILVCFIQIGQEETHGTARGIPGA